MSLLNKKKYEGACALFYDYEIRNKEGKLIKKQKLTESKSFVKAFIQILHRQFTYTSVSIIDTGNISRTSMPYYIETTENAGSINKGLIVGTGTDAVTINDYKLQTTISNGTTAGKLQYGASTMATPTFTSTTGSMILTRVISNNSPGNITINEIGIYAQIPPNAYYCCIARDIPTPIILAIGEQLTLNYTIGVTI